MAVFVYRAADQRGRRIDGVMEAPDARMVIERLQREAYFPMEVTSQVQGRGLVRLAWPTLGQGQVKARELAALTQQLAMLLEAGLPLDRALGIQEELATSPRIKSITGDVLRSVRGGASFGDALATHHPRPFSRLYINMVRAGEKGGVLEVTLKRLAEFLEDAQAFRDALVSALIYPSLLALVGSATVVFLMAFVIPRFADIFRDLGQAIPVPTQILLSASTWLQQFWWAVALGALAAALAGRVILSTASGRLRADRVLLRLPVLGELALNTEVARFTRILGTLLQSGVSMVGALTVVRDMMSNQLLAAAVASLGEGVKRGTGLTRPMIESKAFPPLAIHMVRVGEETGRLDDMLLKAAAAFESATRSQVKRLIALAEPCIILAVGLLVGFIVVAMLLAIFSITDISL